MLSIRCNSCKFTKNVKHSAFISKYNWEGINCPSEKDAWKKFEKNILTIALNVLYAKKDKIHSAYVSKHNSKHEKQVILLMISNGERWRYFAIKILSTLLKEIISKNNEDFYCLDYLYSFRTKNILEIKIFLMLSCLLRTLRY